jgi:FkbM family methyltransferase
MSKSMAYYLGKIEREGLPAILARRARWYGSMVGGPLARSGRLAAGWVVERLLGDRVRIDGLAFSTASPLIARSQKGEMLFGRHEAEERRMLGRWLPPELPVVEFGGGIGVVSCLANRRLARPEQHVVVEANPGIIPVLERNRDLNGCRFRVVNKALAYDAESVAFSVHPRFTASRIGGAGATVDVAATSLERVIAAAGFDRVSLICDVEGAEAALVERELETIRGRVRTLLVEIHPAIIGAEATSRLIGALEASGFVLRDHFGINWAFARG